MTTATPCRHRVILPLYSQRGERQFCEVQHYRTSPECPDLLLPIAHCRWCAECKEWVPSKDAGNAKIEHP